jgi:hypothetical protein
MRRVLGGKRGWVVRRRGDLRLRKGGREMETRILFLRSPVCSRFRRRMLREID